MIRKDVKNTLLFNEFSDLEQKNYFSLNDKKFIHGIDNIYYTVSLQGDSVNLDDTKISLFIDKLNVFKQKCIDNKDKSNLIYYDDTLELIFRNRHFKIYEFCLSLEGLYDIFVSSYIPNDNTPRVVVQCRSIGLWLNGYDNILNSSLNILKLIFSEFDIKINKIKENRIDYCYHTNYIQSSEKYFSDTKIINNVHTTLDIYQKVGRKRGKNLTIDYLSFGQRRSNNIFFRVYNKTREVIEKNYKGFFIDTWYNEGLISYYDKFILEYAYEKGTYESIEWGKLEFYLKHGKDFKIKSEIDLLKRDYSTNLDHVRQYIKGKFPDITYIVNIEFQTMRKFYYYSDKLIETLPVKCSNELSKLFRILDNRKIFLDYLTDTTISFKRTNFNEFCNEYLKDKNKKNLTDKDLKELDKLTYMDFWYRLRNLKIPTCEQTFHRLYPKNLDINKLISRFKSTLSSISLYLGKEDTELTEDFSLLLSYLNDNDINNNDNVLFLNDNTGEILNFFDENYINIKEKKKKALGSLLVQIKKSQGTS